MRVAVTGATGIVGQFVVADLLRQGHEVSALRRTSSEFEFEHERLHWFVGDLANVSALSNLIQDCDGFVHAAFEHVPGKYRGGEGDDPQKFFETNVNQSLKLIEMLESSSVGRTVFFSSRAVYDGLETDGNPIQDNSTVKPTTLYGKVKVAVEERGSASTSIGFCSLRPTGIYGVTHPPQRNKWFGLVQKALSDLEREENLDSQMRTEVHGEDVASATVLLLNVPLEKMKSKSFNCSDIAVSQKQLYCLVQAIKAGYDPTEVQLPTGLQANNPMSCEGLAELGWCPGGMEKLYRTLGVMIEASTLS